MEMQATEIGETRRAALPRPTLTEVLFVGENFGRPPVGGTASALLGRCGNRLASLLGVGPLFYRSVTRRLNLCLGPRWDALEARRNARRVLGSDTTAAVLCGRKVWQAFGCEEGEALEVATHASGKRFLLLPHPSGRNRFWNDLENVRDASTALRQFCAWS